MAKTSVVKCYIMDSNKKKDKMFLGDRFHIIGFRFLWAESKFLVSKFHWTNKGQASLSSRPKTKKSSMGPKYQCSRF